MPGGPLGPGGRGPMRRVDDRLLVPVIPPNARPPRGLTRQQKVYTSTLLPGRGPRARRTRRRPTSPDIGWWGAAVLLQLHGLLGQESLVKDAAGVPPVGSTLTRSVVEATFTQAHAGVDPAELV